MEGPAVLSASTNNSHLSHRTHLVIPTEGRDLQCALRLSQILPFRIYPYPQPSFAMPDRKHSLVDEDLR